MNNFKDSPFLVSGDFNTILNITENQSYITYFSEKDLRKVKKESDMHND